MDFYCARDLVLQEKLMKDWNVEPENSHYFRLELEGYQHLFESQIVSLLNDKTILSLEYGESEEIIDQQDKFEIIKAINELIVSGNVQEKLRENLQQIKDIFVFGYIKSTTVFID